MCSAVIRWEYWLRFSLLSIFLSEGVLVRIPSNFRCPYEAVYGAQMDQIPSTGTRLEYPLLVPIASFWVDPRKVPGSPPSRPTTSLLIETGAEGKKIQYWKEVCALHLNKGFIALEERKWVFFQYLQVYSSLARGFFFGSFWSKNFFFFFWQRCTTYFH